MKFIPFLIGIPLQLLGLSGLVENIITWQGFIENFLNIYAEVKAIIFGWLPFAIPSWVEDYLVIGIGLSAAHIRASLVSSITLAEGIYEQKVTARDLLSFYLFFGMASAFVLSAVLWPLVIFTNTVTLVWRPPLYERLEILRHFWIGLIVVFAIFVGSLFLFSDVAGRL